MPTKVTFFGSGVRAEYDYVLNGDALEVTLLRVVNESDQPFRYIIHNATGARYSAVFPPQQTTEETLPAGVFVGTEVGLNKHSGVSTEAFWPA